MTQEPGNATDAGVTNFDLKFPPTGIYEVQLFDGKRLTQKRIAKE